MHYGWAGGFEFIFELEIWETVENKIFMFALGKEIDKSNIMFNVSVIEINVTYCFVLIWFCFHVSA